MADTLRIRDRLEKLESSASQLEQAITDKKARDHFVRPISNAASDVEFTVSQAKKAQMPIYTEMWYRAAELALERGEQAVSHAQEMIAVYGADTLRVFGL